MQTRNCNHDHCHRYYENIHKLLSFYSGRRIVIWKLSQEAEDEHEEEEKSRPALAVSYYPARSSLFKGYLPQSKPADPVR